MSNSFWKVSEDNVTLATTGSTVSYILPTPLRETRWDPVAEERLSFLTSSSTKSKTIWHGLPRAS